MAAPLPANHSHSQLLHAVHHGTEPEIAALLVGVDPNLPFGSVRGGAFARTSLPLSRAHLACAQKGKTPLFEACRKGRDRVAAILLAAKADPNFPDFVRTPASRSDYHAQLCERV